MIIKNIDTITLELNKASQKRLVALLPSQNKKIWFRSKKITYKGYYKILITINLSQLKPSLKSKINNFLVSLDFAKIHRLDLYFDRCNDTKTKVLNSLKNQRLGAKTNYVDSVYYGFKNQNKKICIYQKTANLIRLEFRLLYRQSIKRLINKLESQTMNCNELDILNKNYNKFYNEFFKKFYYSNKKINELLDIILCYNNTNPNPSQPYIISIKRPTQKAKKHQKVKNTLPYPKKALNSLKRYKKTIGKGRHPPPYNLKLLYFLG